MFKTTSYHHDKALTEIKTTNGSYLGKTRGDRATQNRSERESASDEGTMTLRWLQSPTEDIRRTHTHTDRQTSHPHTRIHTRDATDTARHSTRGVGGGGGGRTGCGGRRAALRALGRPLSTGFTTAGRERADGGGGTI